MAKKRKTRRPKPSVGSRAKGEGRICVMTRRPRGNKYVSQTTCYKTMEKADAAYLRRKKGAKSIMVYARGFRPELD